ncbi:unnamed protein product [Schistosoma turkestanicum]|nr:unnamed protein product [Schistosoma turkestanicum]
MGNETSQTSGGQENVTSTDDTSHKRSQSLQRDLAFYHVQNSSDTGLGLSSNSMKSQSQSCLREMYELNDYSQDRPSPKLPVDTTSTTGIALLKTVQMELTDEEKERIQQVLARARLVEMKEDERVICLISEKLHVNYT